MNYYQDNFFAFTKDEEEFRQIIGDIRTQSQWVKNILGSSMFLTALNGYGQMSMEGMEEISDESFKSCTPLEIPDEILADTLNKGTRLAMKVNVDDVCVRDCGYPTIMQTLCGITGPGVTRLWGRDEHMWAKTLNEFIASQNKNLIVYESCGKVSGVFTESYTPMEIEDLISIAEKSMSYRLGNPVFEEGTITHSLTDCLWSFPDKEQEIIDAYMAAAASHLYGIGSFTPVVRFQSSNTGASCAALIPMFKSSSRSAFTVGKAVRIRHDKKKMGGATGCGIEDFRQQANELMPAFKNGIEVLGKMSKVIIAYPENAFIAAANWAFGDSLPRKWASNALETFLDLCGSSACTMHDIFLGISDIATEAEKAKASQSRIADIDDALGKFFTRSGNWEEFDVAGHVAWNGSKKAN